MKSFATHAGLINLNPGDSAIVKQAFWLFDSLDIDSGLLTGRIGPCYDQIFVVIAKIWRDTDISPYLYVMTNQGISGWVFK